MKCHLPIPSGNLGLQCLWHLMQERPWPPRICRKASSHNTVRMWMQ